MTLDEHDLPLLLAILEGVLDAIITINERGVIQSFNKTAERMFGYAAEEVIGENVSMLMEADHGSQHDQYLRRYIETGERKIIGIGREVMARRKDGTTFPCDLGVTEHFADDRRIFIGVLRDITQRRMLEAQLRQSQKLEAIGTLAAGVAHDFNNILMGIRGCMKFASSKIDGDSPAQRFLEEAQSATDRGARLTRQLLDFSRRTPTEHRRFGLNSVVDGADTLLRQLLSKELQIVRHLDAPRDEVQGDPGQIEQVVMNLVINARDAIEGLGQISISTSNVERAAQPGAPGGVYVRLSVEDDGCGMDEGTISRIFEPFYTTKPPDKGTGLGLSTVYGIIEEHGGVVSVRSELGAGTIFDVDLPLAPST